MINPQLSYRVEQEIQNNYKSTAQSQMQDAGLLIRKFMQAYSSNPDAVTKMLEKLSPRN
jgi:hypothetical protein